MYIEVSEILLMSLSDLIKDSSVMELIMDFLNIPITDENGIRAYVVNSIHLVFLQ